MDMIPTVDARRARFPLRWPIHDKCYPTYQDCESPKKAGQLHFSHQGSRNIAPTMTAEQTNSMVGMARISISQTTA
jgi:hypothetical protein